MDPDQFKQFMEVFTTTIATLVSGKEPKSETNYLSPFEHFDSKKEKFSFYLERFENYCSMKNISDKDKQAQLLCVSVGSTHYNNLTSFLGPQKPVNKLSYDELVKMFKQMLMPMKSVVVAQHYFLNIYQKENQSISEFVADLQRDLSECQFFTTCECENRVSIAGIFLRAQFIRGLRDNCLREQILQSDLSSFDDILTKAIALEASKIESRQFQNNSSNQSLMVSYESDSTNKVSISNSFQKSRSRSLSTKSRPNFRHRSISHNQHPDFKSLGIENLCLRCGRNNHKANECRVNRNKLSCKLCKKNGHVARVCIKSLMSSSKIKQNDYYPSTYDPRPKSDQNDSSDEIYGIKKMTNCIQKHEVVNLFEMSPEPDKYLIDVSINGKIQKFEIDSGAKYSLLAEDDFQRLNLNILLQPSNLIFKSYSGNIIKPKGKVLVNVAYNGKFIKGELHIVPAGFDALLGRQWIRNLHIELHQVYKDMKNSNVVSTVNTNKSPEDIFNDFANIFEEKVGCVPDFKISLQLREGVRPIFTIDRCSTCSSRNCE